MSLVETLRGESTSPPPDEPPNCHKHDGLGSDGPPCRACQKRREQWEADVAAFVKPKPLPPLCGDCDNRWVETDDGLARCPRCNPKAVAS